jgi:hypothetical protein
LKTSIFFLIAFLLIGCNAPKPQVYPQWYKNRELRTAIKYEIIGYGQGKTLREAEAIAKEDIAQTLISKVNSNFTLRLNDSNTTENFKKASLEVVSKLNLRNVINIKQEYMDGIFYVALKYKNLDLAYRIKTAVDNMQCGDRQVTYLSQSPLIQKITASIGCNLDFKLDRRNEAWYLKYKEYLFLLSDDEFEKLYFTKTNKNFEFKANKKVLIDGDSFYFSISSKKSGYITLLTVYENGIVTLLQPSIPIKNKIQIPTEDNQNYFEAALVKDGFDTYDLYVALYTEEPLDMSRFEYASEELSKSELSHKYDELMEVMNQVEYSTIFLRTLSKK